MKIFPAIVNLHYRAYQYARTALSTLVAISSATPDLREALWNWGIGKSWDWLWSYKKDGVKNTNPHAPFSGLAHWFGPFSEQKLNRVKKIFKIVVHRIENGVGVGGAPILYTCNKLACKETVNAFHLLSTQIVLCPHLLDDFQDLTSWYQRRSLTVFHEHFHTALGEVPYDVPSKLCSDESKSTECYRLHEYDDPKFWPFIGTLDKVENPRRLIAAKRFDLAINNVDNYVSWALRRYIDPQFGFCGLPTSPEWALTQTGKTPKTGKPPK